MAIECRRNTFTLEMKSNCRSYFLCNETVLLFCQVTDYDDNKERKRKIPIELSTMQSRLNQNEHSCQ